MLIEALRTVTMTTVLLLVLFIARSLCEKQIYFAEDLGNSLGAADDDDSQLPTLRKRIFCNSYQGCGPTMDEKRDGLLDESDELSRSELQRLPSPELWQHIIRRLRGSLHHPAVQSGQKRSRDVLSMKKRIFCNTYYGCVAQQKR